MTHAIELWRDKFSQVRGAVAHHHSRNDRGKQNSCSGRGEPIDGEYCFFRRGVRRANLWASHDDIVQLRASAICGFEPGSECERMFFTCGIPQTKMATVKMIHGIHARRSWLGCSLENRSASWFSRPFLAAKISTAPRRDHRTTDATMSTSHGP